MNMRVLISGFEPSWGIKRTPSGELAKLWSHEKMPIGDGIEVQGLVLPQQFGLCTQMITNAISSFQPQVILMFGATQKNEPMRLERFAINVESTPMGDNTRIPVRDRPILRGGPSAYEATLPIEHLIQVLNDEGIDAKPSFHAGTHTCNSIMYGVLHWLATHPEMKAIAGFVHVSYPNEFGVIADEAWTTASWAGITKASVALVQGCVDWVSKQ